jgi:adenine-specific DNA methylase
LKFCGLPTKTLLETSNIPIEEIARLAIREGHRPVPPYNIHRWFARRLGSQFRSILAGLALSPGESERFWDTYLGYVPLDNAVVLDPFTGGGTSLVEALHCNARVIGYEIDPVASLITRTELSLADLTIDEAKIRKLSASVSETVSYYHKTETEHFGECDVLHHFWVEKQTCPNCGLTFETHPHYRLSQNAEKEIQWAFCKSCYAIQELPLSTKKLRCDCGNSTTITQGTLENGKARCPTCGTILTERTRGRDTIKRPDWFLFAQEYIVRSSSGVSRHFKPASDEDRNRYAEASVALAKVELEIGQFAPQRKIPAEGRSSMRPLIHGFARYRDLFNDRQLLHLTLFGHIISAIEDKKLKNVLAVAFSEHLATNCMYTAYAFGYRRISPLFSVHSYRHIVRPVEINPWLVRIGRGTFPNTLRKIVNAVEEAKSPSKLSPSGGRVSITSYCPPDGEAHESSPSSVLEGLTRAAVVTRSSEDLREIPNNAIDLILTDPPYFNNISYSELSDFYLAWHQVLGVASSPYENSAAPAPLLENMAATSRSVESVNTYRRQLRKVFSECFRVLTNEGVMAFTYHHNSVTAWYSLAESLVRSGFECTAVVPLRGEGQGGLNDYRRTIKWDAVFVCRKPESALPCNLDSHELCVSLEDVNVARQTAFHYFRRFLKDEKLGFRKPDRLNFERALICAAARAGDADADSNALLTALKKSAKD